MARGRMRCETQRHRSASVQSSSPSCCAVLRQKLFAKLFPSPCPYECEIPRVGGIIRVWVCALGHRSLIATPSKSRRVRIIVAMPQDKSWTLKARFSATSMPFTFCLPISHFAGIPWISGDSPARSFYSSLRQLDRIRANGDEDDAAFETFSPWT
jgi:hypothetical protein